MAARLAAGALHTTGGAEAHTVLAVNTQERTSATARVKGDRRFVRPGRVSGVVVMPRTTGSARSA